MKTQKFSERKFSERFLRENFFSRENFEASEKKTFDRGVRIQNLSENSVRRKFSFQKFLFLKRKTKSRNMKKELELFFTAENFCEKKKVHSYKTPIAANRKKPIAAGAC